MCWNVEIALLHVNKLGEPSFELPHSTTVLPSSWYPCRSSSVNMLPYFAVWLKIKAFKASFQRGRRRNCNVKGNLNKIIIALCHATPFSPRNIYRRRGLPMFQRNVWLLSSCKWFYTEDWGSTLPPSHKEISTTLWEIIFHSSGPLYLGNWNRTSPICFGYGWYIICKILPGTKTQIGSCCFHKQQHNTPACTSESLRHLVRHTRYMLNPEFP